VEITSGLYVDGAAALLQSDNSAVNKLLLIHMYHALTNRI